MKSNREYIGVIQHCVIRSRGRVGEDRRRVQELHVGLDCGLVEVMGFGLINCGEGEDVVGVHTSLAELYRFAMNFLSVKKRKRKRNRDGRKRGRQKEKVKAKRTHARG